jgi:hypothetical protein
MGVPIWTISHILQCCGSLKGSWQSLNSCITLTMEWCALRKHLGARCVKPLGYASHVGNLFGTILTFVVQIDWHKYGCTFAGAWACEELGNCGLYHCWLNYQSHFGAKFLEEWSIENFEVLGISLNWCKFLPWSTEWLIVAGIPSMILSMQETTQRHVYWLRKYGFLSF